MTWVFSSPEKIQKNNENFHSKKDVTMRNKLQKKTYFDKISLFVNIKNFLGLLKLDCIYPSVVIDKN
jgi:hypothetical protein